MDFPAKYVSRSAWGAKLAKSVTVLPPRLVDGIVYHYTGSDSDEQADHANCAGRVRGIQRYHMETKGWSDIAYSFVTCKHGYIFEGRGLERMSAATFGHNDHTLAICFLGDDSINRDDVTVAGRQGIVACSRYIRSKRLNARKIWGHRDLVATSCPGNELYGYIHSTLFLRQLEVDNAARLATLRTWILARHAEGWGWKRIKESPNWREFVRRGGK
jgi:hypothetical protein